MAVTAVDDLREPLAPTSDGKGRSPRRVARYGVVDMEEIVGWASFRRNAAAENRKLWQLAGPIIFSSVAQYSIGAATQIFAGHLSTLELDAVSTENSVIAGLAFGIMLGMGSALETISGQAFGANQHEMLGVYLQRSWVLLTSFCLFLLPIYLFATNILRVFHVEDTIAVITGRFALYMIPQLFAYALNFPIQKFLQAQSKVITMAIVAAVSLVFHIVLSWLLIVWFKMGLVGAAIALNMSSWFVVFGQFAYIVMGYCPGAWNGFSWLAFSDLKNFAKLSIGSAIMLCLEFWYYMFLIVIVGNLANPQVAVAAVSICMNLIGWELMVFLGFNAAISVRVSNELGARRPRAAKFSILIVIMWSVFIGLIVFVAVLALRKVCGVPFTNSSEVVQAVSDLGIIFAFSLLLNSIQPVLSGVAVGAGWQWLVAYINLGCYYGVGLPLGYFLGFTLHGGVQAIWGSMIFGVLLQTIILIVITLRTNWEKEASDVSSRIAELGGGGSGSPELVN